ncbi:MAG: hypothetical protein P8K80_01935 [Phycisphaerales bacterium]|nr:hypothetical protein [Phycisphaerales bacterium]
MPHSTHSISTRCLLLAILGLFLATPGTMGVPLAAVPAVRKADNVAILSIEGPITSVTANSLKRRMDTALADGADTIVIRLDTPGGELMSTLEICRMLKAEAPANTVAWVDPYAFSAGTVIALACRETVISPGGMFGDSAPVSPMGPIPQTERAKIESPLLAEVVDSARRNHYDEQIVQAFVSLGIELWLLENTESGQRIAVDRAEYKTIFQEEPPDTIPAITPSEAEATPIAPWFETMMSGAGGSGPASEDLSGMVQRPSSRTRLGPGDREQWVPLGQIVSSDRLLALTPSEAIAYGLVPRTIANESELKAFLGANSIRQYDRSWSETLVMFLVSWPVRIILIVIFLVCLFVEFAIPGTGIFAAGSAGALLILLGAPWIVGLAQWWDILFVFLGLALVGVELFLLPGGLIAGIGGALLLLAGLVGTFVSGDMNSTEMVDGIFRGIMIVIAGLITSVVIMWWLGRKFEHSRFASRFILKTEPMNTAGAGAAAASTGIPSIGEEGVAITDLRPAGRIRCGDAVFDAVSSGRWIRKGDPVRIIRNEMTIKVEAIQE